MKAGDRAGDRRETTPGLALGYGTRPGRGVITAGRAPSLDDEKALSIRRSS